MMVQLISNQDNQGTRITCEYPSSIFWAIIIGIVMIFSLALSQNKGSGGNLFHGLTGPRYQDRVFATIFFGGFAVLIMVMIYVAERTDARRLLEFLRGTLDASDV